MENKRNNKPEDLDFYREIVIAYENILTEIDFLVEGSLVFTEQGDPRKIKLDEFLHNLTHNMKSILNESKRQYEIRQEVERRFDEIDIEFLCDDCYSKVESRVGLMKWNNDNEPSTPEEWELMEKINEQLGIPVRWITICANPNCRKTWKEGEFEEEIVLPKTSKLKEKIRKEVLKSRGGNT